MSLTIAYLVNQYPKVSHSFIRREIAGLEACGINILRFSIRSCSAELVDPADQQELKHTRMILASGLLNLGLSLLYVAFTKPIPLLQALWLTLKVSRTSDRSVVNHIAYLVEACVLLRWLKNSGVAHVHAHFGTNSTDVAMLCHVLGGPPYSFTVHGPEEFDRLRELALIEKFDRAKFVVTISSFGRSQLYRWCKLDRWCKIHEIHCGVDDVFLARSPVPIAAEPRLVCVGRLCEAKGQLLLLQAVRQLASEGLQFKLVLVGDGELRAELELLIARLQIQNWVEITGWASSEDVRHQILSARAMVLPSFAEGLPVVIMESLALGRPVISTYVAGIPELIESGRVGWLIPAGSVDDLAVAMRSALTLPVESLERMGSAGVEQVAKCYNSNIEAAKLAELFQSTVKKFHDATLEDPRNNEVYFKTRNATE